MKKLKRISIILMITFAIMGIKPVFASNYKISPKEYTEEYKKYLLLTDDEKSERLEPRMFEVKNSESKYSNPIKYLRSATASLENEFQLSKYIPENVVVKNQMNTGSCWTFAALSSLETNLALSNYYNNLPTTVYDFSERHMEYATSRTFLNGVKNPNTILREVGEGGGKYVAIPYLLNGSGAINENDMPFENNEDKISISKIQNKTIATQIYDTIEFESSNSEQNRNIIKNHIKTYGAVAVLIHGAQLDSEYYNSSTGAIYCDDVENAPIDHAVSIVGWDDNYSRTNFNSNHRPSSNGAWIIKNSWGTSVGKNGFMYISYEDVNIYEDPYGIMKSTNEINYENIYQYNYTGENYVLSLGELNGSKLYMANIFNKKTSGTEYITQVGIYATEGYTCKVYVNPNGTSKNKSDLQLIELKSGDSQTFDVVGYHTLEFLNPVKINASSFVVAIEIQGNSSSNLSFALEVAADGTRYQDIDIESGKCFYKISSQLDNSEWGDFSKLTDENPTLLSGDSTIKAFTVSEIADHSLKNIEIKTPPTKTTYFVGENFDKTGMVVKANYNDDTSKIITDYTITNGSNLTFGQQYVKILYEDKEVQQAINVVKNTVESIQITKEPNKTKYFVGEDFDKTGMVVKATYKNGAVLEISDYTIQDGTNLKEGKEYVTITYEDKTARQTIEVIKNTVESIQITKEPNKTTYFVGENFDKTGMVVKAIYQNGESSEITGYTVTGGSSLQEGQEYVTISYENKQVQQRINVIKNTVDSIAIITPPNKTEYIAGENFDKTGMVVQATYKDETKKEITAYTIENGTNLKVGQQNVIISYDGKNVTQNIRVAENSIESIAIITPPNKTEYIAGENFDKTGMIVQAVYKDGTRKEISDYTIDNGANLQNGQQSVIISYGGKSIELQITVKDNSLSKIEVIKAPNKTQYIVGQDFDKTGMIVRATYENGYTNNVTEYTIINGTNLQINQKNVTIKFEDKTTTQEINVSEKAITKISILKLPNKIEYIQNKEKLDLTGGIVKVEYNDGSNEQISMTDEKIKTSGFDNQRTGKNIVTLEYEGKTVTFEINITKGETAQNSDFSNIKYRIPNFKAYMYTNGKQDYVTFEMEINNILRKIDGQEFEYYYGLTGDYNEEIDDWVLIAEEQQDSNKLKFSVNTKDIKKYKEIMDSPNLYVFIKEIAKKDGDQKTYISEPIEIIGDEIENIEAYINDIKIADLDTRDDNNEEPDNTIAGGIIPQTGLKLTIIIAITIITVSAVVIYIKYVKFSKEIK